MDAPRAADAPRRQVARSGFASKREARRALEEQLERLRGGAPAGADPTVAEFLDEWLASKRNLRDTTRRNYSSHIRLYLRPGLGHLRLADLRPAHVDDLYTQMLRHDGAAATAATAATVHHVHRTLRAALNTALRRRLVTWNPALHLELPEHRRPRTSVWEPDAIADFLDAASHHRLYALFHVLTFTGMRRGEALGLHWADVDMRRGHLRVEWQVTDAGAGPRLGPPKTDAGRRVVPLDPATVAVLADHQRAQQVEQRAWGAAWTGGGLVFTREDGAHLRPDGVTHLFGQLVARAGVPRIRLHDLRHTHASIALAAGIDVKVVSDRLGHSSTVITRDLYTHVVPAVARSAADAIASAVAYRGRPERGVPAEFPHDATRTGARAPPGGGTAGQG